MSAEFFLDTNILLYSLDKQTQYRFYDSLMVAAAIESGAPIFYSEDLQHERHIGPLQIINPFL